MIVSGGALESLMLPQRLPREDYPNSGIRSPERSL